MKHYLKFCLLALAAIVFFDRSSQDLAIASPVEKLPLSSGSSHIDFVIQSALFPIQGEISRYSGSLTRLSASADQFDVEFECDLSSVRLVGAQGLPVDQLTRGLSGSKARFKGQSVARTASGALRMKGVLSWKGESYDVTFPVSLKSRGKKVVLEGTVSGSGEEIAAQLPVLAMFQIQRAQADASLTFESKAD